ncbi:hypothetical protein OH77DRAFT_505256 [Trametes cingulata]|nr:hypothetical protein OH77DRAFT_505256 [Trametes cingulata]
MFDIPQDPLYSTCRGTPACLTSAHPIYQRKNTWRASSLPSGTESTCGIPPGYFASRSTVLRLLIMPFLAIAVSTFSWSPKLRWFGMLSSTPSPPEDTPLVYDHAHRRFNRPRLSSSRGDVCPRSAVPCHAKFTGCDRFWPAPQSFLR